MKLLLIITGSIAAKKCIKIIKQLTKKNISIDLIITESAKKITKHFGFDNNTITIINR